MNDHQRNVGNYDISNNLPETLRRMKAERLMKRALIAILAAMAANMIGVLVFDGAIKYTLFAINLVWSVVLWFTFGKSWFQEYNLKQRIDYLTKEATRLWGLSKSGSTPAVRLAAYELWKRLDAKRNEAMRIHAGEFEPEKINL